MPDTRTTCNNVLVFIYFHIKYCALRAHDRGQMLTVSIYRRVIYFMIFEIHFNAQCNQPLTNVNVYIYNYSAPKTMYLCTG